LKKESFIKSDIKVLRPFERNRIISQSFNKKKEKMKEERDKKNLNKRTRKNCKSKIKDGR